MSRRKVSVEDKIYAVNLYLDGKKSQRRIAHMFDVSLASVQQWIRNYELILSRLVDTFFSRISPTMQLPPKHHSIAYVLPWAEGLHWQSRSSGCSNS